MSEVKKKPAAFKPYEGNESRIVVEPYAFYDEDSKNPLSALHGGFSRFSIAALDDKDGSSVRMNMRFFSDTAEPNSSYSHFRYNCEYALQKHMEEIHSRKPVGQDSPAFTLVFKSGRDVQGKTCAQVLKEATNGREILINQRDFLERNLDKYKGNKKYIDAINDALNLSEAQYSAASDSLKITLFQSGLRGNDRKKNKNNKCFCFDGTIEFLVGADSPLKITITNFYAPMVENGNLKTILTKDKNNNDLTEGNKQITVNLNFGQFLRMKQEFETFFDREYARLAAQGKEESDRLVEAERKNFSSHSDDTSDTAIEQPEDATPAMDETKQDFEQNNTISEKSTNTTATQTTDVAKDTKKLVFQSIPKSILKDEGKILSFKANFVTNNNVGSKAYTIIISEESQISDQDFNEFKSAIADTPLEFEMECYNAEDGIHMIKLVA